MLSEVIFSSNSPTMNPSFKSIDKAGAISARAETLSQSEFHLVAEGDVILT
jgi:hypothetical protein